MWRLLGTGGHMGVVPGPCRGPLPGPAAAVAAVASGGGGLRGCSRFGDHAHGSSGDVDARFVGLLGCGGPGPRPIAAAPARWADLLGRRWWRRRWRWQRRRRCYSARWWSGRAGSWLDTGHAGAARRDAGRVLLVCGGAADARTTIVRPPAAAAARRAIAAGRLRYQGGRGSRTRLHAPVSAALRARSGA